MRVRHAGRGTPLARLSAGACAQPALFQRPSVHVNYGPFYCPIVQSYAARSFNR